MAITGQTIAAIADPAARQAFSAMLERLENAESDVAQLQDYAWALNILTGKLARLIPQGYAPAFAKDIRAELGAGSSSQRDSSAGQQLEALCSQLLQSRRCP